MGADSMRIATLDFANWRAWNLYSCVFEGKHVTGGTRRGKRLSLLLVFREAFEPRPCRLPVSEQFTPPTRKGVRLEQRVRYISKRSRYTRFYLFHPMKSKPVFSLP